MGLLGKIKNVLFEEEEIEIPVFTKEKTEEIKEVPKVKESKPILKRENRLEKEEIKAPVETKKEEVKVDNSFVFPVFDESEFKEPKKFRVNQNKVTEKKQVKKVDFGRFENKQKEAEEPRKFKPSPVISPVYGVLDKNYIKDDFVSRKTVNKEKVVDIDSIRNKAYGAIEDEITKSFEKKVDEFYEEVPSKTIDELLIDSVDEKIEMEEKVVEKKPLDLLNDIEENIKKENLEDTLESDLFNLIDSMYSNREEDK